MNPQDFLKREEFNKLLDNCSSLRERALLLLMGDCGLRVSEVARLRREHIAPEESYIYVVQGKGKKDRTVVAPKSTLEAIATLPEDGYLFPGRQDGHLSSWEVGHILDIIAHRAGLQRETTGGKERIRKRITPHLLRHSHASWLLDAGLPVSDVQSQLGHTSLATTGFYLQRKPNHRRENMQLRGLL